ncbi:hypothetical protein HYC85_030257 [Camellia sinensis]|uniref:Uncharacterized protein n=1 Tax=Camellia sinensis TaxID=4442 RepID=A0A7J7G482_CAMSI|nr:hypothetical protein HYC85_030257 [Camellia sinensis]
MLDIETGVWTQVMATGNGPCARFSMAGDSLDPQKSGILVFLGGCSKNLEALDDMFYLHTGLTTENERDERRLEKLSLRKQLKLKCQEQNMLTPPAYDKALVRIETNADLYQPIPMPSIEPSKPHVYSREYQPFPRKRTFQAKVTKCFPVGYTIETIIDGKILHGVLFSNKLSFNHIDDNSKRRKGAVEIDGVKLKDNQKSKSEIDSAHGKNTEAAAATANTKSPAPSDASQPHEVIFYFPFLVVAFCGGGEIVEEGGGGEVWARKGGVVFEKGGPISWRRYVERDLVGLEGVLGQSLQLWASILTINNLIRRRHILGELVLYVLRGCGDGGSLVVYCPSWGGARVGKRHRKDAGNLKVPVVADINVEDNETGIAPNSSMEVHKENPSSADKDYHFVPNPRGQSIDC